MSTPCATAACWVPNRALGVQSDGRGWARNTVNRLCIDLAGKVSEPCTRDTVKESYLTPTEHPITVRLTGEVPVGAICAWTFEDGEGPRQSTLDCAEPINFRAIYGRRTVATVEVTSGAEAPVRVTADIAVRDILIAGLGDSIASGEGNPDRPVALSDDGFCFRSYLGGPSGQFYRPSRAGFKGGRACDSGESLQAWQRAGAQWFNAACHRSLYSYQTRAALALAVQYPHIAVTYLPLACSGATIADGLLGGSARVSASPRRMRAPVRAASTRRSPNCAKPSAAAKRRQPARRLDLVLLSIGANDINFSGLVADVIVENADRTRAVQARRHPRLGRGLPQRAGPRTALQLRQGARSPEAAARRRHVARGVCRLRQPDFRQWRTLPRRPGRLRHASVTSQPIRSGWPMSRISSSPNSCRN